MNELLKFLQSNVPPWLTSITAPLTLIAKRVTSTDVPQTRLIANPQTLANGKFYLVPANPRRKQIIFQAEDTLELRDVSDRKLMTLSANTPWTVETTDGLKVYNGVGASAWLEIIEIVYA